MNHEAFGWLAGISLIFFSLYVGSGINYYLQNISNCKQQTEIKKNVS